MFMFEAINNDVDLIILDDPITSFDKDKKYAVIKRLFDNKRVSFTEKTVLMITHDLQPLIDLVYNNMFKRLSLSTKIKACYIENDKGLLNETDVSKQDLINCLQFSINTAKNPNYCMPIRVVNLRKYIEMTNANYFDSNDYSIVSNLIHGRIKPLLADGTTEMNSDDANSGMEANLYSTLCVLLSIVIRLLTIMRKLVYGISTKIKLRYDYIKFIEIVEDRVMYVS